jgi:hypothetical protein
LAHSVTSGYGTSGTGGFQVPGVKDRFHDVTHSGYFSSEFVRRYWVPFIKNGTVSRSKFEDDMPELPWWTSMLGLRPIFPWLMWLVLFGFVILTFFGLKAYQQFRVFEVDKVAGEVYNADEWVIRLFVGTKDDAYEQQRRISTLFRDYHLKEPIDHTDLSQAKLIVVPSPKKMREFWLVMDCYGESLSGKYTLKLNDGEVEKPGNVALRELRDRINPKEGDSIFKDLHEAALETIREFSLKPEGSAIRDEVKEATVLQMKMDDLRQLYGKIHSDVWDH